MTQTGNPIKHIKHNTNLDPITVSVVWNKLLNITSELGERVVLAAQSFVMAEARDLGPVLLNPKGQIVTQVEYLPCHCLVAELPTQAILKKFGKLNPGDLVLANDSHIIQSGHLPDWTLLYPIYYQGEAILYCHFRGHVMDTGGAYSGSYFPRGYDCISEGLNIPPVKIIEKGKVDQKVREVIFDNIGTPAGVWSDMMTMYGSMKKGEQDIVELCDKYGVETVQACCDEMIKRGEEAMRKEIAQIPDGEYYGEAAVDWDGSVDRPVWIRVKLTVKGEELTFDFSDSSDQVDFVNSPLGNTFCYVYLALYLAVDPSIPHNHGAVEPVHIIAPRGKVVNPTRPRTYGACACSCGTEIYEACCQALGKANPVKAQAPYSRHFTVDFSGRLPFKDPRTGADQEYFAAPFIEEGGSGANRGYDGWDGMCSTCQGGVIVRGSVEECELVLPFRWWVVNIAQNSEGPGQYIGARGVYAERECVAPPGARTILMSGDCSGQFFSPCGVAGAPYAPIGTLEILRKGKKKRETFRTLDMADIYAGEILYTTAGGGGGWGNPLDRDIELVKNQVRDETISVDRARKVYGVVIDPGTLGGNPENIAVDIKSTEALRKKLRKDPLYRHVDEVRDDVRASKITAKEAKATYGVVMERDESGRWNVNFKATEALRPH